MARGLTNDVASIIGKPASASIVIKCIFCAVGMSAFSFCRPSRGPTSTMRTAAGREARPDIIYITLLCIHNAKAVLKDEYHYFCHCYSHLFEDLLHAFP